MDRRTRYPHSTSAFGTARYDTDGNRIDGEFNQNGQRIDAASSRPSALSSFRDGAGTPGLDSLRRLNSSPMPGPSTPGLDGLRRMNTADAGSTPQRPFVARPVFSTPTPGAGTDFGFAKATADANSAFAKRPLTLGPAAATPARAPSVADSLTPAPATPAAAKPGFPRLLSPDEMALRKETLARDAAARTTAPIPLPGGDPAARAWNTARGTGHASTPEPGAAVAPPVRDSVNPVDPATLAVAGTGRVLRTPWGAASSTVAQHDSVPDPAIWSDTGVTHLTQGQRNAKRVMMAGDAARAVAPAIPNDSPGQRSAFLDRRAAGAALPMPTITDPYIPGMPVSTIPGMPPSDAFEPRIAHPYIPGMPTSTIPGMPKESANPVAAATPPPIIPSATGDLAQMAEWRKRKVDAIAPFQSPDDSLRPVARSYFPRPRKPATPLMDQVAQSY